MDAVRSGDYIGRMATTDATDVALDILWRIQAEQASHRQETRALQQSLVDVVRLVQRFDTRISDIKSDLETMFKMELVRQNAHHQARMEQIFEEAVGTIRERLDRIGR